MLSDKGKAACRSRSTGGGTAQRHAGKSHPTTGPSFTLKSIPGKTTADKRRVSDTGHGSPPTTDGIPPDGWVAVARGKGVA